MSCHLIILYRKHCVFYIIQFIFTNQILEAMQLFFVIFTLFGASFIQMRLTCVRYILGFMLFMILKWVTQYIWQTVHTNFADSM